ncbi:MAG: hypothetical protein HYT93_04945 [Parcubacteria group bacterium]|nr:hypothetical protein [Parcubacteria group bacterium]
MNIGLDFDGVISDCAKLKSEGAKRLYGVDIPPEKFKKEIVLGEKYLTEEQYLELQQTIYETREVGFLMEPVAGVLHFLPRLIAGGHTIRIITSRDGEKLNIAKEWSSRQGLELDFIGVGGGTSKAPAAAGLDLFVDDDLDKLEPLVGVVPHLFLFSWGYNTHLAEKNIARRIHSWEELHNIIEMLHRA